MAAAVEFYPHWFSKQEEKLWTRTTTAAACVCDGGVETTGAS